MPFWMDLELWQLGLAVAVLWLGLALALSVVRALRREAHEQVRRDILAQLLVAARRGLPLEHALRALGDDLAEQARPLPFGLFRRGLRFVSGLFIPPLGLSRTIAWAVRRRRGREAEQVADVAAGLAEGDLGHALGLAQEAFDPSLRALLGAAERQGSLVRALEELQQEGALADRFRGDLRGRLLYPLLVLSSVELLGIFVAVAVLPRYRTVLARSSTELSSLMQWLPAIQVLLLVLTPLLLVAMWLAAGLLSGRAGRWSRAARLIPGLRGAERSQQRARLVRALAAFLRAGVPLQPALVAVTPLAERTPWRLDQAARRAGEGAGLVGSLAAAGLVAPDSLAQLACAPGSEIAALDALGAQARAEQEATLNALAGAAVPLAFLGVGTLVASIYVAPFLGWKQTVEAYLW